MVADVLKRTICDLMSVCLCVGVLVCLSVSRHREELWCLEGSRWLNDSVVNTYMTLLNVGHLVLSPYMHAFMYVCIHVCMCVCMCIWSDVA